MAQKNGPLAYSSLLHNSISNNCIQVLVVHSEKLPDYDIFGYILLMIWRAQYALRLLFNLCESKWTALLDSSFTVPLRKLCEKCLEITSYPKTQQAILSGTVQVRKRELR